MPREQMASYNNVYVEARWSFLPAGKSDRKVTRSFPRPTWRTLELEFESSAPVTGEIDERERKDSVVTVVGFKFHWLFEGFHAPEAGKSPNSRCKCRPGKRKCPGD